jgi:signal transduction histidine kinase
MTWDLFSKIKRIFSREYLHRYPLSVKKAIIISIIIINAVAFTFFVYFQQQTEQSIRDGMLEQQEKNQKDTTKALAQHISSDMGSILARLQGLSYSKYLQEGDLTSNNTKSLFEIIYRQINFSTPVDRLFIVDTNGIVQMNIVPEGQPSFIGRDVSYLDWVNETKDTMLPQFSDIFMGADNRYRIAVTHPIIINSSNGTNYIGLVGAVLPINEMFGYYGNIYDIDSKYLAVLDSKGVILVHPIPSLIGKPFNGSYFQNISAYNKVLNNLISTVVFSGKPSSAIYSFVNGERLTSGYPILLNGKNQYSAFIITPTTTIYSKINSVIAIERLEMFSLIVGIIAAVMMLILFLSRMNSMLAKGITTRTIELKDLNENLLLSNQKLESANEQLEVHANMQKEFINIAAHELRSPIQPILSIIEVIKNNTKDKNQIEYCNVLQRNALRLKKIAENILDITRIESNTLNLEKENFELGGLIFDIINDYNTRLGKDKKIKFEYEGTNNQFNISGDRIRIGQVISNLIDNSVKFISKEDMEKKEEDGVICVNIRKTKGFARSTCDSNDNNDTKDVCSVVIVSVKDNGKGIDKEVLPKIFTKFTTKSFQGIGLGLFISKTIIEAHGGKIWGQNNEDGKGSTFSFVLPFDNFDQSNSK